MSASSLQQSYEKPSPKPQNGYPKRSASPLCRRSTSGNRSPSSPKSHRVNKAASHGVRADLSTSTPGTTEHDTPVTSRVPSSDTSRVLADSNDDLSNNSQDSPEAHQLMPGVPGVARRAKAHVPSACVNCKKKHLACETKRPCNRCMQTGKEATCVDVQHKKRGRPRLREEESLRGLAFGPEYPTEELYEARTNSLLAGHSGRHRSKTYRELRSQPETSYLDQRPRTSDSHFSQPQYLAGTSYSIPPQAGCIPSEFTPTAVLTTDFVVAHHNGALTDALALSYSARGQALLDLVVPAEKERIRRLQSSMRNELRDATHASSAYINGQSSLASIPIIESIDIVHATAGFRMRSEYWTFRLPYEQSRGFPISISLAKKGSPFVILTLVQSGGAYSPTTNQGFHTSHALASPVSITTSPPMNGHRSHQPHNHHHHNGSTATNSPYLISPTTSTLDDQILSLQPTHSLAQYKHSPPRSVQQLPHTASGSDSSTSRNSGTAASNPGIPRSSPGHQNQPLMRDNLRHLQLPPIRSTPTSDPSTPGLKGGEPRRRVQSGTPSPGRSSSSSAHGGKRKKRRRVEIGDILR